MAAKIFVFVALLAVVFTAPAQEPIPVVALNSEVHPDGSFQWNYQSGDGTVQEQSGQIVGAGDNVGESIHGSAAWTDNQGGQHQLTYTADENGYQPQSADLPVAPAIPEAIQRSLEWNAAHPQEEKHENHQQQQHQQAQRRF